VGPRVRTPRQRQALFSLARTRRDRKRHAAVQQTQHYMYTCTVQGPRWFLPALRSPSTPHACFLAESRRGVSFAGRQTSPSVLRALPLVCWPVFAACLSLLLSSSLLPPSRLPSLPSLLLTMPALPPALRLARVHTAAPPSLSSSANEEVARAFAWRCFPSSSHCQHT